MQKNKKIKIIASIVTILPAMILLYAYLQPLVDIFTYKILHLHAETHLGAAINFFIYDTIKILILLFLISSLMGVINAYFPVERLRVFLTNKNLYGFQYFFASFFRSGYSFLFLFVNTTFYWFCKRRNSIGCYFFLPYHLPFSKRSCSCDVFRIIWN